MPTIEEFDTNIWFDFYKKYYNGMPICEKIDFELYCGAPYKAYYDIQDKEFENYTFIFATTPDHLNHFFKHLADAYPQLEAARDCEVALINGTDLTAGLVLTMKMKVHPLLLVHPLTVRN